MSTDPLSRLDLVSAVSILGPATDRWVLDRLRDKGFDHLRPAHGYVIQRLITGPQTTVELAASLGVSQQAASRSAAEVVTAGYVERTVDESDGRRQPLVLTERGTAMIEASRSIRATLTARLAAAAGADQAETARQVLLVWITELGLATAVARRSVPMS